MIVSHEHRFIFIKTRKTAGTSIEVALSQIAGEDAIVTPVKPEEPGHNPRNYTGRRRDRLRWGLANPDWPVRSLPGLLRDEGNFRRRDYYNHMPAWLIRAKVGRRVWRDYYRFCCERNPWDKMVSLYSWRMREEDVAQPFEEWLMAQTTVGSDWSLYTLDGRIAVDAVVQFDQLGQDLAGISDRLGAPGLTLPRAKGSTRRDQVLYSTRAADHVRRVFHREIEAFGYECPPELLA
jgi:hypothetical protein